MFKTLVGSLSYLTCTRHNIIFAVRVVSHFVEDPTSTHLKVSKRILHYLKDIIDLGLFYSSFDDFNLVGYVIEIVREMLLIEKLHRFFLFFLGDCVISWSSKKQLNITLSTCETEYVAVTSCTCHAIWLRRLLKILNLLLM